MVAIPEVASFAQDEDYNFDKFIYDEINDSYTCPQHQVLTTGKTLPGKLFIPCGKAAKLLILTLNFLHGCIEWH